MCDCHRRLRLPQSCSSTITVSNADGAVVGLRRRHLYGNTRHSVLSVTVQVAGPGGGRGGVGVGHRIPQLARVAFEECPTGTSELGVQRA